MYDKVHAMLQQSVCVKPIRAPRKGINCDAIRDLGPSPISIAESEARLGSTDIIPTVVPRDARGHVCLTTWRRADMAGLGSDV
jgi:hypothetical protein